MIVGWDTETTTIEKGHVHHPDNFLVSSSFATSGNETVFTYYKDPDFREKVQSGLDSATELVGFNLKFDVQWAIRTRFKVNPRCHIWDCQLAEFILNGQVGSYQSLNEALEGYGFEPKLDLVKEYWEAGIDTPDIPVEALEEYNNDDAEKVLPLREAQLKLLSPRQIALVYAQGRDLLVLAKTELNGVRYDVHRAQSDYELYSQRLGEVQRELEAYLPKALFSVGDDSDVRRSINFNWDSGDQLSALLYGGAITYEYTVPEVKVYGPKTKNPGQEYVYNHHHQQVVEFPRRFDFLPGTEVKKTKDDKSATTRFYQVDDTTLRQIRTKSSENRKLLTLLGDKAKLSKILETFEGIEKRRIKYQWGNFLHGRFNQNVVRTGRLSSSDPNMQNSAEEVDVCLISRYD